jgi:hypothetical protein
MEGLLQKQGRAHTRPDQQCVVLNSLLPHKISIGYEAIYYQPLLSVNGTDIHNICDVGLALVTAQANDDQWFVFACSHAPLARDVVFSRGCNPACTLTKGRVECPHDDSQQGQV